MDILKSKTRELTTMDEGNKAKYAMCSQEAMLIDPERRSIRFRKKSLRFRAKFERCWRVGGVLVGWEDFVGRD